MKSNCISSFGFLAVVADFFSVLGMLGLILLPAILQGTQLSHFFWIASVLRGHQKCLAAIDILFIAGCPLCKRLIIVVLRFFGTIILSSKKTSPYLEDNFFLYMESSSGMLSCCCRSRHTTDFSILWLWNPISFNLRSYFFVSIH